MNKDRKNLENNYPSKLEICPEYQVLEKSRAHAVGTGTRDRLETFFKSR